jgi:hypothetical protein
MPSYSSKLVLSSAASSSGVAIADVEFIKGAFYTVAEYDDLADIPITRISDGQIVWVEDVTKTYQATITLANPPASFTDTVAWAEFTGFGGSGGGSGDITSVIAGGGLTGGASSGTATLEVGEGDGITVGVGLVSLNTGSVHFAEGVQKTNLDGGDI